MAKVATKKDVKGKKTKTPTEVAQKTQKKRSRKFNFGCSRGELKRLTYAVGIKKSTRGLIDLLDEIVTNSVREDVRRSALVMNKKTKTLGVKHLLMSVDDPMFGFR